MFDFGSLFAGGFGLIIILILCVAAVLTFLIPFFILKIRNEVISINGKMGIIIELLEGESEKFIPGEVIPSKVGPDGMKICGYYGALNGKLDKTCVKCGEPV
jgi:hypothetical protein